jgi:hypothetical protein
LLNAAILLDDKQPATLGDEKLPATLRDEKLPATLGDEKLLVPHAWSQQMATYLESNKRRTD